MQNSIQRRSSPPPPPSSGGFGRLVEGPASWLISFVLIPGLLAAALLLPPVKLLDRLKVFAYTRISAAGGAISDNDGTLVVFPGEGMNGFFLASIKGTPRADFLEGQAGSKLYEAAQQMPKYLSPRSPYYSVDSQGTMPTQAILTIPIPNDSLPYETLGLYTWTGNAWELLPSTVLAESDKIESRLDYVPANFMVMQTLTTVPPAATASLGLEGKLPDGALVAAETKPGLYLRGDGALEGTPPAASTTGVPTIIELRNWEGDVVPSNVPRTDLLNNLLLDPGLQVNQLDAIERAVVEYNYSGVTIDYRGVDAKPSARADFAHFIGNLAERLHASSRTLSVRVEPAQQVSAEEWNTGGYDWRALGRVADQVIIPAPDDPRAYRPSGELEALLRWATGQVERSKIQVELPGQSVERSANYLLFKGYKEALQPLLGQVQAQQNDASGEVALSLENPRLREQVSWDTEIGAYHYTYIDDQGLERTVFIENAQSLAHKLTLLQKYNVRNVVLRTPSSGDIDPNTWNVLLQFQQGGELSSTASQMSVAYRVLGGDGQVVMSDVVPLNESQLTFPAPAAAGELRVEAQLVGDRGEALSIPQSTMLGRVGSIAAAAKTSVGEGAADAAVRLATAPQESAAKATATDILNAREGPGTDYPILGQLQLGSTYKIVGKNSSGDWFQIDTGSGKPSWVLGQLITTAGDTNAVAVVEDIPAPTISAAAAPQAVAQASEPAAEQRAADLPAADPAPEPEAPADAPPAAAPVVSAPPPSGGGSFGYGVQTHMVDMANEGSVMALTQGMGFNWVKQQVEWKRFEDSPGARDFGPLDGIVGAANGAGINLLFSVVNAPAWAREANHDGSVGGPPENPQTFADFLGALASKYCGSSLKAIEVWNEQNLHYEWGNRPLDPGAYVALLAPSYAAIKAACPSMYVISGALTPAGNNPGKAVDDFSYLEGMFQAGLANYADGIGAHPSGYNVPASATWEEACAAIQVSGNSFNGACDSPHHSWSFRSTMEGYKNIMNVYGAGNKLVWPTEFGWAAGGAFHPAYQYANDNSYEEQAQWTVEAYTMMRNWGWVGPAFLWNLNFRMIADGTEKAQWGIVDAGGGPLPAYSALAAMPK